MVVFSDNRGVNKFLILFMDFRDVLQVGLMVF